MFRRQHCPPSVCSVFARRHHRCARSAELRHSGGAEGRDVGGEDWGAGWPRRGQRGRKILPAAGRAVAWVALSPPPSQTPLWGGKHVYFFCFSILTKVAGFFLKNISPLFFHAFFSIFRRILFDNKVLLFWPRFLPKPENSVNFCLFLQFFWSTNGTFFCKNFP